MQRMTSVMHAIMQSVFFFGVIGGVLQQGEMVAWVDSLPLEDRIRLNLRNNPVTAPYADQMMLTVYDGMVIVEGSVRFTSTRDQIAAVIQQTNGVYRVDNRITLQPLPGRRAPTSQVLPRSGAY